MRLCELRQQACALATTFDPALLSLADAKVSLADATALKNVAAALEGKLALRVAIASEWEREGFASPEAWLAARTGTSAAKAKETLDTAERLRELPAADAAAANGELSAEQAAAIADAASADPSAEQELLDAARDRPLGKLRDDCARRKRRADPDPEATHRRLRAARQLGFSSALDGAAKLFGVTTPEQMATIKAAVNQRANVLFDEARRQGRHEPHDAYLMDALEQICAEWLAGTHAGASADPAPAATPKPQSRPSAKPAYLGLLRLDLEALLRGAVEGDERCEITGLGPIPVSIARGLLGDSVLKLVITRGVDVANVTHLGRGPTIAQKIALLWQSPGCSITTCHRTAGIEHDHRADWADTRHTVLDELDRLCDHHHDLKTYKGWAIVRGDGGATAMVPPDDPRHPRQHAVSS